MKFATLATIVTATAGFSAAQPHRHAHDHLHKRDMVTVYELNGHVIPNAEVQEGLANGTLVMDAHKQGASVVDVSAAPKAKPAKVEPANAKVAVAHNELSHSSVSGSANVLDVSDSASFSMGGKGVNTPFPSNEISCSTFPSEYGPIEVPWLSVGGWTGIQAPKMVSGAFDDILTIIPSMCSGSDCCKEGMYCSYACPAGYQKTQWPKTQGLTGQSIGGLLCKNGKLQLTNPASHTLCSRGNTAVNVVIKNTMSEGAAVCRTDYPGLEAETIPVNSTPGSTIPLAVPDSSYFNWNNAATSAQLYVNPKGVPVQDGCKWGDASHPWGNFAPLNLGVGYSNGAAYLSLIQNTPTTDKKLDFTVEILGDHMSGKCRYSKGQYCSGENYETCTSDKGCTVSVPSGTATFVFSE